MKANKGEYVVLLSDASGNNQWKRSIEIGYVFKLRDYADLQHFYIELDMKGSTGNGWSGYEGYDSKLEFRPATQQEIEEYNKHGKPCKVIKEETYEIY